MKPDTQSPAPIYCTVVMAALAFAGNAFAQVGTPTQDQATAPAPTSETTMGQQTANAGFGASDLTFTPQAGALIFEGNQRMATGLLAGVNLFKQEYINVGISAGALYSGLNNTLDGASGFSSGISGSNHTYMWQVPMDIVLTLFPNRFEKWNFGPHIGSNVIYSSSGVGNAFGTNSSVVTPGAGQGATWNAWFNVGPEVTYNVTNNIDIDLRYDATFASAYKINTLTIGIGFTV